MPPSISMPSSQTVFLFLGLYLEVVKDWWTMIWRLICTSPFPLYRLLFQPKKKAVKKEFSPWKNPNANVVVSYKDFRRVETPYESYENKKVVFNRCSGKTPEKRILKGKWGEVHEEVKKPYAYHDNGEPCWDPECPEFDASQLRQRALPELKKEDYLKEEAGFIRSFKGALIPEDIPREPAPIKPTRKRFSQHSVFIQTKLSASKLKAKWRLTKMRREEMRRMAKIEKSWAWEVSEIARLKKDQADQKADAEAAEKLLAEARLPPQLPLFAKTGTEPGSHTVAIVVTPPISSSTSLLTESSPSTAPSSAPSTAHTTPVLSRASSMSSMSSFSTLFSSSSGPDCEKKKKISFASSRSSARVSETIRKAKVRFAREQKPPKSLGLFETFKARQEYNDLRSPPKPERINWEKRGLPENKWWKRC
ncbi:hypothetical protein L202_01395 [Cryptococcus amylolentus CBS 6039]|uniref:Uncharacterized protein n=1 Tax=Cryptococcus amylolentus CBS 6039 TaxID=1295533 RepID=A0A1E3I3V8_9TREE|nr:hypothetical protein L202_01395 [Cryptococcus amylolentus CBS 6039]ODN83208.1 hypothetical protein L202_01395 [Cryptococcus amylolentus CBS 6039]